MGVSYKGQIFKSLSWEDLSELIVSIAQDEAVKRRRSDHNFRDFQRYVTDLVYIVRSLEKKSKILDIGAGAGVFSIALARLGLDITATNSIHNEIQQVQDAEFFENYGCDFAPLNLDKNRLPFADKEFDMVLCLHVLEHLKKPTTALVEIKRILKPGGILILMTPNGVVTSIYHTIRYANRVQGSEHVKEYTPFELANMLTSIGFEIHNLEYSSKMAFADVTGPKRLFVDSYSFFCNLFPIISYEIHMTARIKEYIRT